MFKRERTISDAMGDGGIGPQQTKKTEKHREAHRCRKADGTIKVRCRGRRMTREKEKERERGGGGGKERRCNTLRGRER